MTVPFVLLAVSQLSVGTPITAVSALFGNARRHASAHRVSGVMAFDGAGFCHYLEGERDAVVACIEACRADMRQTDFAVVHDGLCDQRHYPNFISGYAAADGPPASEVLRTQHGEEALLTFLSLARSFDLEI